MQSFIHEALMYYGYSAKKCIIDNTNLAVFKGSGRDAIFVPEMEQFARSYSFKWLAHEISHSDRKASVESSFKTVNCNFIPGRTFKSIDDLNAQAQDWCQKRSLKKVSGVNQTPEWLFTLEKPYLNKLPSHISPPYMIYTRKADQYGFISFKSNYYYVGSKHCQIEVLYFETYVKLFKGNKFLWKLDIPLHGESGKQIAPKEFESIRTFSSGSNTYKLIASKLSEQDPILEEFLREAFTQLPTQKSRTALARQLEGLEKIVPKQVFLDSIKKSLKYKIFDGESIKQLIKIELSKQEHPQVSLEIEETIKDFFPKIEEREAYQSFKETPDVDLSKYAKKLKKEK